MNPYLDIRPDVASALAAGRPVVALESTIISHGMPYPENVKTALSCEEAVRSEGALPATVAVLDGKLVVGLSPDQIEFLGKSGRSVLKTSRRDLGAVLSRRQTGATTVAGTMIACSLAGIRFFATGGIGGVHRGAETTMDVSADLEELAKTPVCVVCAGVKSILDLGKTLEYLETRGVPVIGFGTDVLPAFYTRRSAFPVPFRQDTAEAVAEMARAQWGLGLTGGIVVANPIPEPDSFDPQKIEEAIERALSDQKVAGIVGKDSTPFLLSRVSELTSGGSLESNIALVLNNCRLAARIACAYAEKDGRP